MTITPDQLGALIDRHWGPLVAWVGSTNPASEDIVQQTFIALAAEHPVPDNPVAWLYRVSRNRCINHQRQAARRRQREHSVAKPETAFAATNHPGETDELLDKLAQLDDSLRQIVVARIWGALSFEDIASVTGMSTATVWRHYQTALQQLRSFYGVICPTEN